MAPPPKPVNARRNVPKQGPPADVFGSSPFTPNSNSDPFGMGDFNASGAEPSQVELENAIGLLDRKILEMKVKLREHILVSVFGSQLESIIESQLFKTIGESGCSDNLFLFEINNFDFDNILIYTCLQYF